MVARYLFPPTLHFLQPHTAPQRRPAPRTTTERRATTQQPPTMAVAATTATHLDSKDARQATDDEDGRPTNLTVAIAGAVAEDPSTDGGDGMR